MDTVTGFLNGPRARDAFLLRCLFEPPFALRVRDDAALTLIAVTSGRLWLLEDEGTRVELLAGDIALVTEGPAYTAADDPGTVPTVEVNGPTSRSLIDGPLENPCESMDLGVRTWGNDPAGSTVFLVSSYPGPGEVGRAVVDALPRIAVLRSGDWRCPAVELLAAEVLRDAPGQQALLDRLLDVVVIDAVRAELSRDPESAPPWFTAGRDPVVGKAIRLLDERLAHPWTVNELASKVGLSRAALARRFAEVLGEPPIGYLTRRRLAMAADLLADSGATVGSVSRRVGYASPFTFSAAFKREYGVSPTDYRTRQDARSA
jgi:AraC-like DNA-binding protein